MNKKVYLINFDKPLPDNIIEEIKNNYKDIEELVVVDKKIFINLRDNIYKQCVNIRWSIERNHEDIFNGQYPIIINLPGFSIAGVYLVNEIEAKLKQKPLILEMIKHKERDSLFSEFEYRRILDLEFNHKITKNNTEEVYK